MAAPLNMKFDAFAEAVKPTGAVNRWPQLGASSEEVVTYSVYLNGEVAQTLPPESQEHEYKDVMLHALTEKLGLNPLSLRDNLKVAEVVSIRDAWMAKVLDASMERDKDGFIIPLAESIVLDYEKLTAGLTHPWIVQQIEEQKRMSLGLRPALDAAGAVVGMPVKDRVPEVVSLGVVVSQNADFTVQATKDGEIVTHENRRLGNLPAVGQDVLVSYYRGQGQVVFDRERLFVSEPYVDDKTKDLAVGLVDGRGQVQQVVLFNSVSAYAKFVDVEGLDKALIGKAIEAREANPKLQGKEQSALKELASDVYVDPSSGCLAVDYMEKDLPYTAIFGSADALAKQGAEFGVNSTHIARGRAMEREANLSTDRDGQASLIEARQFVVKQGYASVNPDLEKGQYIGSIVAETSHHVIQNVGRQSVAIHDKRDLDKLPKPGDKLEVSYEGYRGKVDVKERGQGLGR